MIFIVDLNRDLNLFKSFDLICKKQFYLKWGQSNVFNFLPGSCYTFNDRLHKML